MRAILFDSVNARLGEVTMPENCRLISFKGSYFVRTDQQAELNEGGLWQVFDSSEIHVLETIGDYDPRANS